jgi:hypothetical protein
VKKIVVITLLAFLGITGFSQKSMVKENSMSNKQVQFFPNPASTSINFEFKYTVERGSVIQLYSFLGRKMASLPISGNKMQVSLNEFITGIYIFQVRDASGRIVESNKFQVAK